MQNKSWKYRDITMDIFKTLHYAERKALKTMQAFICLILTNVNFCTNILRQIIHNFLKIKKK